MKKLSLFILAACTVLFFPSCRKAYDLIKDHPDAHETFCRITQLTFGEPPGTGGLRLVVAYNAKGNPLSLRKLDPGNISWTPVLYFRYDKFDRLSDFMYTTEGGPGYDSLLAPYLDPPIWHKYAYPHPGIIVDTFLAYDTGPLNGPSPIAKPGVLIYIYKFNAEGKMIAVAETSNLPDQPAPVFNAIAYDARGNRDLSIYTNVHYDSTVNVYRTNKVWQLVFKDYSRNNPVYNTSSATPTNPFGLPTRLPYVTNANVPNFYWYNPTYYPPYYYIDYACAMPKGPIDY